MCQQNKPATTEFFYATKYSTDGLRTYCKPCNSIVCSARERGYSIGQLLRKRKAKARRALRTEKRCKRCRKTKPLASFWNKGAQPHCKRCQMIEWRARKHGLSFQQASTLVRTQEQRRARGVMECSACAKIKPRSAFRDTGGNWRRGRCKECLAYRNATPEEQRAAIKRTNAYTKRRVRTDPVFRLRLRISASIRSALYTRGRHKYARTFDMLGYSPADLMRHLERLFEPWMTWDNWGRGPGTWQIDHIRPMATFDFADPKQIQRCWALSNLRPLCSIENNARAAPLRLAALTAAAERRRLAMNAAVVSSSCRQRAMPRPSAPC